MKTQKKAVKNLCKDLKELLMEDPNPPSITLADLGDGTHGYTMAGETYIFDTPVVPPAGAIVKGVLNGQKSDSLAWSYGTICEDTGFLQVYIREDHADATDLMYLLMESWEEII